MTNAEEVAIVENIVSMGKSIEFEVGIEGIDELIEDYRTKLTNLPEVGGGGKEGENTTTATQDASRRS